MRQMDRNQQLPVTQMRRSRMVVPGKRLPNKNLSCQHSNCSATNSLRLYFGSAVSCSRDTVVV